MLKYQYFIDTCKNKGQQLPELNDIAKERILIGYSDLEIWFSIKKCSDHIEQVRKIWEVTDKVNCKAMLDNFLLFYAQEVLDVFNKYKQQLERVKQLQLIDKRLNKLVKNIEENEIVDVNKPLSLIFKIDKIEEFNILDFQKEDKNYVYSLELSYQTLFRKIKGQVEMIAQRLNFQSDLLIDLNIDIGTLQLNLLRELDNEQVCIAQRNLDPFSYLNEEMKMFPLKMNGKEGYLNLSMSIICKEQIEGYLKFRQKYLQKQYERMYRKCHKYKTKLTLLLRPFEQIRFDDENIYLQKLQMKQNKTECWNCQVQ